MGNDGRACGGRVFQDGGLHQGGNALKSLTYRRVRIGLERPFSVLHISDTHLTAAYEREGVDKMCAAARRTCTFGGRQEEALRDSLAWAKQNVDYVLHTGDLMDFQSEANFDLVKKCAGETLFGAVGNHEFYTYLPVEKKVVERGTFWLLQPTYCHPPEM